MEQGTPSLEPPGQAVQLYELTNLRTPRASSLGL